MRPMGLGAGTGVGMPTLDRSDLGRVGLCTRGLLLIECGRVRRERHRLIGCRGLQESVVGGPYVPASASPVAVQLDHPVDQVRADLATHTGQGRSSLVRAEASNPLGNDSRPSRWHQGFHVWSGGVLRSAASGHPSRLGSSGAVAGAVGARVARGDTYGTSTRRGEAAAEPRARGRARRVPGRGGRGVLAAGGRGLSRGPAPETWTRNR